VNAVSSPMDRKKRGKGVFFSFASGEGQGRSAGGSAAEKRWSGAVSWLFNPITLSITVRKEKGLCTSKREAQEGIYGKGKGKGERVGVVLAAGVGGDANGIRTSRIEGVGLGGAYLYLLSKTQEGENKHPP